MNKILRAKWESQGFCGALSVAGDPLEAFISEATWRYLRSPQHFPEECIFMEAYITLWGIKWVALLCHGFGSLVALSHFCGGHEGCFFLRIKSVLWWTRSKALLFLFTAQTSLNLTVLLAGWSSHTNSDSRTNLSRDLFISLEGTDIPALLSLAVACSLTLSKHTH